MKRLNLFSRREPAEALQESNPVLGGANLLAEPLVLGAQLRAHPRLDDVERRHDVAPHHGTHHATTAPAISHPIAMYAQRS